MKSVLSLRISKRHMSGGFIYTCAIKYLLNTHCKQIESTLDELEDLNYIFRPLARTYGFAKNTSFCNAYMTASKTPCIHILRIFSQIVFILHLPVWKKLVWFFWCRRAKQPLLRNNSLC